MTRPAYCYLDGSLIERPRPNHPDPETWSALRQRVFAEQSGKCATCPSPAEDLHHRHYDRFGSEARADVIGLCRQCHEAITSRLRAYRYGAGQLSVREIAEKVQDQKIEIFRPALSVIDIPSLAQSKAPDRFRPKQRAPFISDRG